MEQSVRRVKRSTRRRSRAWLALPLAALLLAGASGWYFFLGPGASEPATAPAIKTATVRTGDITLAASGTGTLVAGQEARLAFKSGGRVVAVDAQTGSQVEAGQVLARLDDVEANAQVAQAQANLRLAEIKVENLKAGSDPAAVAAAQASLAAAQADLTKLTTPPTRQDVLAAEANLASARVALEILQVGPTAAEQESARIDLENAKQSLDQAKNKLWQAQTKRDGVAGDKKSPQYLIDAAEADVAVAQTGVEQAEGAYAKAKIAYDQKIAGPSAEQLAAAQAKVAQAQAQLDTLSRGSDPAAVAAARSKVAQAQAQLDAVLAGASARDLESAQLAVEQARNNLKLAQAQVENTKLKAPFGGTVTAVTARVGEMVGTAPVVTIADLDRPLVQFYFEETDLDRVKVGHPAEITFSALPDAVFPGQVKSISPSLVTRDNVPAAEVTALVDPTTGTTIDATSPLLVGMGADVKITAASAKGALLVPREALRSLGNGRYGVFVVGPSGELELRTVEVGLQDQSFAEVKSGLSKGEVVSTGTVATK